MKLASDLREFIGLLNCHGVEYVVVGGHAVAYHGYPRYTGDIDILVRPSEANGRRVLAVLEEFGFRGVGITLADVTTPGKIIQLGEPPNRIDLLTQITAVEFERAWAERLAAEIDGLPVFMLGRDALLANKRATGRAKDRADLEALAPQEEESGR